ncbi:MAG: hypothetical protein Tsb009_25220 [Planctomycetaceae bacterium]
MNRKSSGQTVWQDEDIESLLTEFFAAEMPAELKQPFFRTRQPNVTSPVQSHAPAASRRAGWTGISAVLAILCLMVSVLVNSSNSPSRFDGSSAKSSSPSGQPVVSLPEKNSPSAAGLPVVAAHPKTHALTDRQPVAVTLRKVSVHPLVVPVELRQYAPETLIQTHDASPKSEPSEFFNPDIEIFPLEEESPENR